jgi:hypothetical protein
MEGHVNRAFTSARWCWTALLLTLPAFPVHAQVAGRWKITIEGPTGPSMVGEMRIAGEGNPPSGRLLLETRDSAWTPLRDLVISPDNTFRFSALLTEPFRFEGQGGGSDLRGTASDQHERKYRWVGVRLRDDEEYYPAPPRFRQRQIVIPVPRAQYRIPGRWLSAARAAGETTDAELARYRELAISVRIHPLPADSLGSVGLFRAMGLFDRPEMVAAAIETLEAIRAQLPSDTTAQRFDYLFHPQGTWLVDIHAVALARAQRPFPTLTWESARPALAAAGLLDTQLNGVETIPLALYRLFALSRSDTAAFHLAQARMQPSAPSSVAAVKSLLQGYDEASQWYLAAMHFLLEQPWVVSTDGRHSPADLVRAAWNSQAAPPDLEIRIFGYPEGAERVGISQDVLNLIVAPDNAPARDWLERHGGPNLLEAMHRLPARSDKMILDFGAEQFTLTSIGEFAASSFSGFLEPQDAILLDPSYQPLLALGTVVHEWQHILHEHRRQADPRSRGFRME